MQTQFNRLGHSLAGAFMAFALAAIAQGAVCVALPSFPPTASVAVAQA
jgi:hypothetical protein